MKSAHVANKYFAQREPSSYFPGDSWEGTPDSRVSYKLEFTPSRGPKTYVRTVDYGDSQSPLRRERAIVFLGGDVSNAEGLVMALQRNFSKISVTSKDVIEIDKLMKKASIEAPPNGEFLEDSFWKDSIVRIDDKNAPVEVVKAIEECFT